MNSINRWIYFSSFLGSHSLTSSTEYRMLSTLLQLKECVEPLLLPLPVISFCRRLQMLFMHLSMPRMPQQSATTSFQHARTSLISSGMASSVRKTGSGSYCYLKEALIHWQISRNKQVAFIFTVSWLIVVALTKAALVIFRLCVRCRCSRVPLSSRGTTVTQKSGRFGTSLASLAVFCRALS